MVSFADKLPDIENSNENPQYRDQINAIPLDYLNNLSSDSEEKDEESSGLLRGLFQRRSLICSAVFSLAYLALYKKE